MCTVCYDLFQNPELAAVEETPASSPTVELKPNDQPRVVSFVKQWPSDQASGGVLAVSNLLTRVHVKC